LDSFVWVVLLAIIQGITEFLPVSSSAHLIVPGQLFDIPTMGLSFDVAVHFGTLMAVVFYYRRTLMSIAQPVMKKPLVPSPQRQQLIGLGLATLPAATLGFFAHDIIEAIFRAPLVIAWTTLLFGILLGIADWFQRRMAMHDQPIQETSVKSYLLIGLAQSLALIPGVSRSGVTMTASLFMGQSKKLAADTSFLLSIPIITMASVYQSFKVYQNGITLDYTQLFVGVMVSSVVAWVCITLFIKAIAKMGMMPFVIYRVLLAFLLFYSLS
jgi:undecaprenyl-diphosphatase